MDGTAKVIAIAKQALTEDAVAALEAPTGPAPYGSCPLLFAMPPEALMFSAFLYWGTRRMVESLTGDPTRMEQTLALFATMPTPLP